MIEATTGKTWEHGSFCHWMPPCERNREAHPWSSCSVLCASGRDAMRCLIEHAVHTRGWHRLLVPSYYCQEVVASLVSTGIEVKLYADSPLCAAPDLSRMALTRGDALLRVNYFGLRGSLGACDVPAGVEVIDDYSHDPWCTDAWHSTADWCVASLRKTLPLPEGGALWSPKKHPLPRQPQVTPAHKLVSLKRLAAMVLKAEYLAGKPIRKEVYRQLELSSESSLSAEGVSGITEWSSDLLKHLPARKWRHQRQENHDRFCQSLAEIPWLRVLCADDGARTCPFAAVMVLQSEALRDHLAKALQEKSIYASVLWPLEEPVLEGMSEDNIDLSRRVLSVQCDARYSSEDMDMVAQAIRSCGGDLMAKG